MGPKNLRWFAECCPRAQTRFIAIQDDDGDWVCDPFTPKKFVVDASALEFHVFIEVSEEQESEFEKGGSAPNWLYGGKWHILMHCFPLAGLSFKFSNVSNDVLQVDKVKLVRDLRCT